MRKIRRRATLPNSRNTVGSGKRESIEQRPVKVPSSYRGCCLLNRPIVSTYIIYKFALSKINTDFAFSLPKANYGEEHSRHIAERHTLIGVTVSALCLEGQQLGVLTYLN